MTDNIHHQEESRKNSLYGFWIYLMTDTMIFGTLFIVYIVFSGLYMHRPKVDLILPMQETLILLLSSFTMGLALIGAYKNEKTKVLTWLLITFLLGLSFVFLELNEFSHMIKHGMSWKTHAYYSSFFALVGTHGLHVSIGLLWILVLIIQLLMSKLTFKITTRVIMLSLFWHFLDIIWIFVFSIVYLIGGVV